MILLLDNDTFDVVLPVLHILELNVRQGKVVTNFTVEDGSTRSDHSYDEQLEVHMVGQFSGQQRANVWANIRHIHEEGMLLIVQTRVDTYKDMILADISHSEPTELFDGFVVSLWLKQWRDVKAREGAFTVSEVAVPQQSDTSTGGVKNGVLQTGKRAERPRMAADNKTPSFVQGAINGHAQSSSMMGIQ